MFYAIYRNCPTARMMLAISALYICFPAPMQTDSASHPESQATLFFFSDILLLLLLLLLLLFFNISFSRIDHPWDVDAVVCRRERTTLDRSRRPFSINSVFKVENRVDTIILFRGRRQDIASP